MNPIPSPASVAFRRLMIVISVAIGLVVFAYGWSVTEINFDKPQEVLRQTNFGNALRELNRLEEALSSFARAAELRPDLAAAHYNLAQILTLFHRTEVVSGDWGPG